ncbi:MAG: DUF4919 domain-containing protein [Bacteroidota bacterium]|nr:DUF4919 domain-containing protein [Bacteroidota bacterium]
MKSYLLTLVIFCFFGTAFGQKELETNYDTIKAKIENPKSDFYYKKLIKRYNDFDSTLTTQEYSLIYYGFSFQKDYIVNQPSEISLNKLLKSNDYEKIVAECIKILDKNPVSLLANNEMGYALYKLNKPESEWGKYQKRFRAIRKAIVYSGDGLSPETAFKVICVSDEYNILYSYFKISNIHHQSLVGIYDKFDIDPSKYYQANVMYFDTSRELVREQQLFDKKK